MPREGFPDRPKDDLRYYTDQDGRITPQLREHFAPLSRPAQSRRAFVKAGNSWTDFPYDCIRKGMVFRVMDSDGMFFRWADDGSVDMLALDDAVKNQEGVWGVRARKPTAQEMADA